MSNSLKAAILLGTLYGISGSAGAADIPPNIVDSDSLNNTAMGSGAMGVSTSGSNNTAAGSEALDSDFMGSDNTAFGASALTANGAGHDNTAVGFEALLLSQGNNNIALGSGAGSSLTGGNNNIYIGSPGGAIKATFIMGITNATFGSGMPVIVSSAGQLGVAVSSERYKTAIAPMGSNTEKLQRLRPVSFHYKTDPTGAVQYGLIAEEVNKIYPELVFRDEDGAIQGVHYEELAPMLLDEVQRQAKRLAVLEKENADLKRQQKTQSADLAQLHDLQRQFDEMRSAMAAYQANGHLAANR